MSCDNTHAVWHGGTGLVENSLTRVQYFRWLIKKSSFVFFILKQCYADPSQSVHLWGLGVMGVYCIMIMFEILKKTYSNRPDIPFPALSNNTLAAIDLTVLGLVVAPADILPLTVMEFPRAIQHVQMTSCAAQRCAVALSQAATWWATDTHARNQTSRHLLFEHHLGPW